MEEKSAYELQRERNIAQNNAKLRSLGLLELEPLIVTKPPIASQAAASQKRKKEDVESLPRRQSSRLKSLPAPNQQIEYSSSEDDDGACCKRKKGKAKYLAPTKESIASRKSSRRSYKIMPEISYVDEDDGDDDGNDDGNDDGDDDGDDGDDDNVVFFITDKQISGYTSTLASRESQSHRSSVLDGIDDLPMPNDMATNDTSYECFNIPSFFMESDTTLILRD